MRDYERVCNASVADLMFGPPFLVPVEVNVSFYILTQNMKSTIDHVDNCVIIYFLLHMLFSLLHILRNQQNTFKDFG